ncbi:major capsid protein, partial [Mesorhizobium sp. M2A.F.Ca.ET.067.02.1.1]|uniref:major capsid protein n=1 Tax=Mesorhizobium sp. M2A.F.Ca.ET.067.02.1.1 TaxID=2496749 RepID=UPI000FD39225
VKDADGTTIVDWASRLGQTIPAEVDFDLDNANPASGALRKKCTAVKRSVLRGLKGVGVPRMIVGLCDDAFWDDLIAHPDVVKLYEATANAISLSADVTWETFRFGGLTFANYRGTDDNSTVAVPADKCKFFPVGAGIFKWAMSPGESFDDIGTMGQDAYSRIILDDKRNEWADVEVDSYVLPVCTMPQALHRARRT